MPTKLRRILIAVCILVVLFCAAWIVRDRIEIAGQADTDRQIVQQLKPGSSSAQPFRFSLIATAAADELEELPPVSEDFADLLAVNEHAVGWISAGERIDEPVVQYDNEFYLTHSIYGEEDSNGVIFVNAANSIWPRDQILLLHGHHMRNQGRFGSLDNFADYNYVKEYPIVTFRTIYDEADVYYVPIAGFTASMVEGDLYYFDIMQINFDSDEEYEAYIAKLRRRSRWQSPVECNASDELIMMVTCNYAHESGRFILVCRKLRENETPASITALFDQ